MPVATGRPPGVPLLVTKLRPPADRDIVRRPALVEALAAGPRRRLTVISGPAGWGKTTLVAAWAESPAEPRPFAWLSLDPGDAEPIRFWTYVVQALSTIDGNLAKRALPLVKAPGVDLLEEALPALLNELAAAPVEAVLVLDDLHAVLSPDIGESLGFFVEHLPAQLELAVTTRIEPQLPLARLRARGELLEIDERRLRFTQAEARALLNDVVGLELDDDALFALYRRTEGWAAGLYLAALSLRERPDRDEFIDDFAGDERHILEYLRSEVLGSLDERLREFLVRTSVLDRLTGPLCDAVADSDGGTRLLHQLERSNLFVVPLDDRRRVYRYHHLFAELLRDELDDAHPGLAPELHRRAAAWHRQAGDVDRAVRHAVAAGDRDEAVELVAEHWSEWLLSRGEHGVIDSWLRALPNDRVRLDPRLCVARTFTGHSLGRAALVTPWVDAAEALIGEETSPRIRGDVAAARASNALQIGDLDEAVPAAQRALDCSDPESPWAPLPHGVLAHARRWSGDTQGAAEQFEAWRRESEAHGQVLGVVCSLSELALLHAEAGRDDDAAHCARAAEEAGAGRFDEHWVSTGRHAALALLGERASDADIARAHAARAVELARRGGPPGARANALLLGARLLDDDALVADAGELLRTCRHPGTMVLDRLAAAQRGAPAAVEGDELSERELQILRLLATDLSQREIGAELYLSLNTVKTHVRNVFRKLGAGSREDAVLRGRQAGLVP